MEVKQLDKKEYQIITKNGRMAFNKAEFCELNREKVDDLIFLGIYKEGKPRFAIPLGIRGKNALCPFSAPFGYPEPVKSRLGVINYEEAESALIAFLSKMQVEQVSMFLPPLFYDENAISMWMNVCQRDGWKIDYIDINYCFYLPDVSGEKYESVIDTNGRRNLKLAQKAGLETVICKTDEQRSLAYEVIQENRKSKGYPLRMTWKQVQDTMKIIPSAMYLVKDGEEFIASALVYEINNDIAQLIYWGDLPGHTEKKAINHLAYELINTYAGKGFSYLDIGPASEDGILNYGLCDFKDSIGCHRSAKVKIYKKLEMK